MGEEKRNCTLGPPYLGCPQPDPGPGNLGGSATTIDLAN